MRIAVLSAARSIHTIRWVTSLAARGHTVELFSMPEHKAPDGVIPAEIQVHYLGARGAAGYWLGGAELRRMLETFRPDVLSAHYATGYGTIARRSRFKPLMLSVWGSDVYEFPDSGLICRRIVEKNIAAATGVASTSRLMAERVRHLCHFGMKIFITPFGVDTAQFRPLKTEDAAETVDETSAGLTIGLVKALEPKYGIDTLLRAFSLLKNRLVREGSMPSGGLRLVIYGSGSQLSQLKKLAAELQIQEQTRFMGAIPHARVPAVLSDFDIFCAPSESESFGVAAVEAMACGVPVVVSDADGFREVVKNGVTGFVVLRRDYVTMANKLYELACNPALRRRMGEAGREHVLENYEWNRCVVEMENALAQTVQLHTEYNTVSHK